MTEASARTDLAPLVAAIKSWGVELGFQAVGIANADLCAAEARLAEWLARGFHGEMDYMARHGAKRARPAALVPGTLCVISARMDYRPAAADAEATLADRSKAYVSRYALGRDYHKVLRARLQRLADRIEGEVGEFGYRVFTDSAPVMEVELAARAGLGWRGKHTLALTREAGSFFFLGEIYTDLPLPVDRPVTEHCGTCTRCIEACPTGAIVAPYELDARRCISYLTIELKGAIPEPLRPLVGNRVYGCDDCQLVCPWNRYAQTSAEPDFAVRHGLDAASLAELFEWPEETFHARLAGSAIHRIGYVRWSRNLAVGLGNAPTTPAVVAALRARADDPSALVREHVAWALGRHGA
ncbi:MAG: tRNA epoxyqueuosine(34) reductase QueG [Burkholderiales bacterium]